MPTSAWGNLNKKGDVLKLQDKCHNPNCDCQKVITFTPHQYMLESGLIKTKLQKKFRGRRTAWSVFLKPGLKMATPLISSAVDAKTKNPQ